MGKISEHIQVIVCFVAPENYVSQGHLKGNQSSMANPYKVQISFLHFNFKPT